MPSAYASLIAESTSATSSTKVLIWSLVLLAIITIGVLVMGQVKKRMRDDAPEMPGSTTGFTLSDLRQLHREGQLSDDEFERAKAKIVAAARKANEREFKKPPE